MHNVKQRNNVKCLNTFIPSSLVKLSYYIHYSSRKLCKKLPRIHDTNCGSTIKYRMLIIVNPAIGGACQPNYMLMPSPGKWRGKPRTPNLTFL